MSPGRPRLRGIGFDPLDEPGAVDRIVGAAASGRGGRVVTPNVAILREASASAELRALVDGADVVVADGAPVVWALRLRGTPVPERVAGSSLAPALAPAAAAAGVGVFLLGGPPGAAPRAAARLQAAAPGLRVGHHTPPMGFEGIPGAKEEVVASLAAFGPAICLCGFGFPRQDRLGAELSTRFPSSWFLGVGATIAFLAGDVARAPVWMQRSGLEWVHRLALEPRRLLGRYLRDAVFAAGLLAEAAGDRLLR